MVNFDFNIAVIKNCSLCIQTIQQYLLNKNFNVITFDNIYEIQSLKIDLIIFDDESQLKKLRKLKKVKLLYIQLNMDERLFFKMLEGNVDGVITNLDTIEELEKAIFNLTRMNKNYFSTRMLNNPIVLKKVIDFYRSVQDHSSKRFSKREIDILKKMKLKYTSKQISDNLFISVRTVSKHRENIYKKLGVNNMNSFFEKVNQDKELQILLN